MLSNLHLKYFQDISVLHSFFKEYFLFLVFSRKLCGASKKPSGSDFPNNIIVAVWSFLFVKDNKGIISLDHIYGDKNAKIVLE